MIQLTCDRQQLVEAVSNVQRAVSSKSSVPALEGILLKAEREGMTLCGFDLELGMTTRLPARIEESGSVILGARLFSDIIRRLPGDLVKLTVDEKNVTTIESGASEFSIAGMGAEEYPELPSVSGAGEFSVQNDLLKGMIRQTIFAVADSDAKPIHTGTLFELSGGRLRLVSVDGYRLAMREEILTGEGAEGTEGMDVPAGSSGEMSFVVPGKTLTEVMKLLPEDDGTVGIQVGRRHILFTIGSYTVISRLLEGEFLDYRSAIPSACQTEVKVNTREFINSVERVSLLITDRLKSPVRCVFGEDSIHLSCSTAIGRANDQFSASIQGAGLEMGFNNRYLLDALRNTEGDEVRIQLNGPLSPMKIMPPEGDSYLFLVLPVRLKAN
ncbi:MAG: DNA polymerase III subunit beta [Hydrogeniiclostridium sp.]|mgnify:FL=1